VADAAGVVQVKRQQMQWTRRGAHLLLQTRTRASMARSGACSSGGIRGWQTTIHPVPVKQWRRKYHTLPHGPDTSRHIAGWTKKITTAKPPLRKFYS